MLTVYQLDNARLLQGDPPYFRQAPTKGHLQVLVAPPAVPAGHVARWFSALHPVADTQTYGDAGTGVWEVVEDHRKDTLWLERGKSYQMGADHQGQSYDGLGPVPAWLLVDEPPASPPTLEELRLAKLSESTEKRWHVMTGGLTLPGGIKVGTTIDDQNRITSVVANAALAGLTDADPVDFKAESGWVRITIAEIKAIAGAVGQFVQACYTVERDHHDAINDLDDYAAVAAYDVAVGWPSGSLA